MTSWSDLQKQSQKLTAHIANASTPIPPLHRDLAQIEAMSRTLRARTGRPGVGGALQEQGSRAVVDGSPSVPLLPWGVSGFPNSNPSLAPLPAASLPLPASGPPPSASSLDPRAASLLSRAGVDPQQTSQLIASIRLAQSYEPPTPVGDTDLETFLNHQHENIILRAIEERKVKTTRDYEEAMNRALKTEWEEARKRIFEELEDGMKGYSPSEIGMDMQDGEHACALPFSPKTHRAWSVAAALTDNLPARLAAYAKSIRLLNEARLSSTPFPIVSALETALDSLKPKEQAVASLVRSFHILATVLGEHDHAPTLPLGRATQKPTPRELQYLSSLRADDASPEAASYRRTIARRSRQLLEREYADHMERTVNQNPRPAALGGIPGAAERARGYVNVVHMRAGHWDPKGLELVRHPTMGECPAWAVIFYLVRSGKLDEAVKFASEVSGELARTSDGAFPGYLNVWAGSVKAGEEGRLPKNLRDNIRNDWDMRIKNIAQQAASGTDSFSGMGGRTGSIPSSSNSVQPHGDPFKYALYKIVGRLDLRTPHLPRVAPFDGSVVRTAEDFLWVQLSLSQERSPSDDFQASSDRFSLRSVASYYIHRSTKYATPATYLNLLLLCGEFERAVGYLRDQEHGALRVEAVQIACACAYYGALRVPDDPNGSEPGILTERPVMDHGHGHAHTSGINRRSSGISFGAAPGSPTPGGGMVAGAGAGTGYSVATLNFARLIQQHVRMFGKSAPEEAVQYLCLVALYGEPLRGSSTNSTSAAQTYARLAHRLISDLVLESREFARLLGSVRADGSVQPGELESFAPLLRIEQGEFIRRITKEAAERVVRTGGEWRDVVLLFYLAGEHAKVLEAVVRKLGQEAGQRLTAIADGGAIGIVPSGAAGASVAEDVKYAEDLLAFYDRTPSLRIDSKLRRAAGQLLSLLVFADEYERGRFEAALATLNKTRILPLDVQDLASAQQRAQDAAFLDDSVARSLSEIVVAGVDCVARVWRALRESRYDNEANRQRMGELKRAVDAVVVYLGKVGLKMSRDTYARVVAVQTAMQ
ncbi:hypothetical protein HDU93_008651 [Gonapodya sp. JEL0774]|nr:hypothetical protein HDU93_008651 [Gonapodya sp. JEL0774]